MLQTKQTIVIFIPFRAKFATWFRTFTRKKILQKPILLLSFLFSIVNYIDSTPMRHGSIYDVNLVDECDFNTGVGQVLTPYTCTCIRILSHFLGLFLDSGHFFSAHWSNISTYKKANNCIITVKTMRVHYLPLLSVNDLINLCMEPTFLHTESFTLLPWKSNCNM